MISFPFLSFRKADMARLPPHTGQIIILSRDVFIGITN